MSDLSRWDPGKESDSPEFPPAFFGYQRKAVDRYLSQIFESRATSLEGPVLYSGSPVSAGHLDRYRDMGREIGDLLSAIQETAARIREQAELDAAQWRGEATTEAEERIAEAQAVAGELRAAAWEVATGMIAQIQNLEIESYRDIEKHSQEAIAEAESESHRIREGARRRAESIRSDANVESLEVEEKTRALCDQMIDSAEQQVSAIQERVLALERHRDQLLEEIGGIRSGAAPIGVKLIDQTGALIYRTTPSEEEVSHVTPHHEMSGLVRVISQDSPAEARKEDFPRPALAMPASVEAGPPEETAPAAPFKDEVVEAGPSGDGEEHPTAKIERGHSPSVGGEFEDIFDSLRQAAPVPSSTSSASAVRRRDGSAGQASSTPPPHPVASRMGEAEARELEEEMLLPVASHFLRLFKRLLSEEQNRVLEGIRTRDLAWDSEAVDSRLRSHLEMLLEQSWQAGHGAAERLAGRDLPKPELDMGEEAGFARQLVADVTEAMDFASSGDVSQRSTVTSRVFRVWRSHTLERHLQELGSKYYQQSLLKSLREAGVSEALAVSTSEAG